MGERCMQRKGEMLRRETRERDMVMRSIYGTNERLERETFECRIRQVRVPSQHSQIWLVTYDQMEERREKLN